MIAGVGARQICIALVVLAVSTMTFGTVFAQGSSGGSIGNDNKSLSGAREESRSAAPRRARPERIERRAPTARRGGGGNFDGVWTAIASAGCAASGAGRVVVSGGTLSGQGVSGSVSSNGALRAVGNAGGITVISTGRLSGGSGSGVYRQSDGCSGTWRAVRN